MKKRVSVAPAQNQHAVQNSSQKWMTIAISNATFKVAHLSSANRPILCRCVLLLESIRLAGPSSSLAVGHSYMHSASINGNCVTTT